MTVAIAVRLAERPRHEVGRRVRGAVGSAAAGPPRRRPGRSARAASAAAERARGRRDELEQLARRARTRARTRSPSGWISSPRGPKRAAAQRFCEVVARARGRRASRRRQAAVERRRARSPAASAANADDSAHVRRLVGDAHLERAELRMRAHVPPDARVVLASRRAATSRSTHASHPRVRAERRRRRRRAAARRAPARGSTPSRSARPRTTASWPRARARPAATAAIPSRHAPALVARSASRRGRAGPARPGAAPRCRRSRRSVTYRSSLTIGCASGSANGMRAGRGDREPLGLGRLGRRAAQHRRARRRPRPTVAQTFVFSLEDRREQLGLHAARAARGPRRPRRMRSTAATCSSVVGVEDHQLLLDPERERRRARRTRCSITSWRGRRAPGGRPRPTRSTRRSGRTRTR